MVSLETEARTFHALDVVILTHSPVEPPSFDCPFCRSELDLYQPQIHVPERMLGVCSSCGSWQLVSLPETGETEALLVDLPLDQILSETLNAVS